MLSTRNLMLKAFTSRKLVPRWIGPYRVAAQHGTAFTLELLVELRGIHPTFHARLLKPFVDSQEEYEVAAIIAHRHMRGRV